MKIKLLAITASLSLFCRILFSIYFSIKIVDENSLVNRYQADISRLTIHHQLLENEHANLTSLNYLFHQTSLQELRTITTFSTISF